VTPEALPNVYFRYSVVFFSSSLAGGGERYKGWYRFIEIAETD